MTKSKLYRVAHEAFMHAGQYALRHRRQRHSQFRRLWIPRIKAAVAQYGLKYSTFMGDLKKKDVKLNRKVLSELAVNDPKVFEEVVNFTKSK